jgi:hypothetical protein
MTNTTNPDTDTLVDTYFAMWRTTDARRRRTLVAEAFADDGRHVDQQADAIGHAELTAMITAVHDGYPGFGMARTSGNDRFADQLRFAWELKAADGTLIVAGIDAAEVAPDGRLRRVAGFWGELPAA